MIRSASVRWDLRVETYESEADLVAELRRFAGGIMHGVISVAWSDRIRRAKSIRPTLPLDNQEVLTHPTLGERIPARVDVQQNVRPHT